MMNHHLPAMNHGQPPMPSQRRQHDVPYVTGPPALRSPPAYMGYPNGHMGHPMYPPQQHYQPHWYPAYPQVPGPHPRYTQQQQHYAPFVVSSYPNPQPSPALSQPMPPPPMPRTSSQAAPPTPLQTPFSPSSPVYPQPVPHPAPANFSSVSLPPTTHSVPLRPQPEVSKPVPEQPRPFQGFRQPFYPPLPWVSISDAPFPARTPRRRRRLRALAMLPSTVEFPAKQTQLVEAVEQKVEEKHVEQLPEEYVEEFGPAESVQDTEIATPVAAEVLTPLTSQAPSEAESTQPTTPSSTVSPQSITQAANRPQTSQPQTRNPRPVVPVVPILPQTPATPKHPRQDPLDGASGTPKSADTVKEAESAAPESSEADSEAEKAVTSPPPAVAPKSWADLVRSKQSASSAPAISGSSGHVNGFKAPKSESLGDVLKSLGPDVSQYSDKIAFIEPRGLVNTGNMCYMNSVLQILIFCIPFYEFLDRVGRRAAHSFKSDSPLIEALIMFFREFRVIDAAQSTEQLRMRLKQSELEQYGEQFTPEYVYSVIRELPRFRDMRRGHQQDAQEFLAVLCYMIQGKTSKYN